MRCTRVWRNATLATMAPAGLGIVEDGLVAACGETILYAGPAGGAPPLDGEVIDCGGRWITPGLIDCHTHLVYGGDRIGEWAQRLAGKSYAEIAKAGGGIRSTMRQTRAASQAELIEAALPRLDAMLAEGVTTVEIKSGYGLTLDDEIKQLAAARALEIHRRVDVISTYLAAHALPPEFDSFDQYIETVCQDWLPEVALSGLADAVDAYCDPVGFTAVQTARVLQAAIHHGLPVKIHAEQFANSGGALVAASLGALSADHLEHMDQSDALALADAGTVAVLLPGAFYFTRETQVPPVALLRDHKVPIAIATDCNPGTSPLTSPLLVMNMAATLFRLSVEECLLGMTRHAAKALGRDSEIGTLEAGKRCDLAIWNIRQPAELVYYIGRNPLHARVWRGQ